MIPLMHSAWPVSAAAVGALVSAIWQGTVLATMVFLCLRLMPGLSATARSAIWLNVFALLVLLHIFPTMTGRWTSASAGRFAPVHLDPRWSISIAAAWAVLSLWRGALLILSAVRLRRMAGRATPISPDPALQALLENRSGDKPAGRSALLCRSPEVARPSVFGFFKPRILIPPELMEKLSADELRLVVLHELEHLRRSDDWSNLLQKVALVLFPLNPVLYWVERRLCCERELACDDSVLNSNAGRKAYALCLTRLAEYSIVHRGLSLALGAWERQSELAGRVYRILCRPAALMNPKSALAASTGLVVGMLACAVILSRSPQLVSFAPLARISAPAATESFATYPRMNPGEMGSAPQLVKAVMPELSAHTPNRLPPAQKCVLKRSTKRQPVPVQPQPPSTRQAWIVLTEWQSTDAPPRIVFAVERVTAPSYAAVGFANGWLIVQI